MKILTIGFTKKSACRFFELLQASNAKRIIDVRLNNASQLAGFTKRDDLSYFLHKICGMEYLHMPQLAPTQEMLANYRKRRIGWEAYEALFKELMYERRVEQTIPQDLLSDGCLLCSEDQPHHCHRRLVAEYLKYHWGDVDIAHLW